MIALVPAAPDGAEPVRNPGFDALRGALTLLVVFHHAAITYGALGGWFHRELAPGRNLSSTLLTLFCTVNQAYFMGLFFLLAGYFTPSALRRKGPLAFLGDRLLRLGLPALFFGWILGPVTVALAATHRDRPFGSTLLDLWRHGRFEIGPLWFAEALLLFAVAAVVAAQLPWRGWLSPAPPGDRRSPDRPAAVSNRGLLAAALATGAASMVLRVYWPVGTALWHLQLGYFAGYVVLFAAGCLAARGRRLERLDPAQVRLWWRVALVALPILPAVYFLGDIVPALRGVVLDLCYAFWEPFVAWGIILKLLQAFQRRFATPGGRLRPYWLRLGRRAYTIYIIHPPVLVAVTLAWSSVPAPALLKFLVTGSVGCVACYLIAGPLLRLPGLRRIL